MYAYYAMDKKPSPGFPDPCIKAFSYRGRGTIKQFYGRYSSCVRLSETPARASRQLTGIVPLAAQVVVEVTIEGFLPHDKLCTARAKASEHAP